MRVNHAPVVRLNRAIAVAELDGAAAGLAEVDAIPGLDTYAWWHATRALLLAELGRGADAGRARADALDLDPNVVVHHGLRDVVDTNQG